MHDIATKLHSYFLPSIGEWFWCESEFNVNHEILPKQHNIAQGKGFDPPPPAPKYFFCKILDAIDKKAHAYTSRKFNIWGRLYKTLHHFLITIL